MPYFLNNSTFAISSSIKGGWVVNKLRTRYKFLELILLAINYCLEKQKFYFFFIISLYRPLLEEINSLKMTTIIQLPCVHYLRERERDLQRF